MTVRIALWSGPRNISTALMYAFAQRADTQVVDEPLYAHYLSSTEAHTYHPGAQEVLADQENDGEKVIRELFLAPCAQPVLFLKNMTHHLVDLDWRFLSQMTNVLLTRHPRDMLASYVKQIEHPQLKDTGYAAHLELLTHLEGLGQTPPILDSVEVLKNPRSVLTQLCAAIGLPFDERMLSWEAGARPEDGVWAPHWYHNVHRSTSFKPYRPKENPLPAHLEPLLAECLPYYEQLAAQALRA